MLGAAALRITYHHLGFEVALGDPTKPNFSHPLSLQSILHISYYLSYLTMLPNPTKKQKPRRPRKPRLPVPTQPRPKYEGPRNSNLSKREVGSLRGLPFLSTCALDYAHTLVNPFNGKMGCLPSLYNIPSLRQRTWVKGELSTGTTSFGFIVVAPINMLINDISAVIYSNNNYAGNAIQNSSFPNTNANVSNSQFSNLAFSGLNGGLEGRLVGVGIRIRSSSTVFSRGGTVVALCENNHESLIGQTTANMNANQFARRFVIDEKWITVCYRPIDVIDYEFTNPSALGWPDPTVAGNSDINAFYMGMTINTAVPGQPFAFEVFGVTETNGRIVRGMTPTGSDLTGLAAVAAVTSSLKPFNVPCEVEEASLIDKVATYITNGISHTTTAVRAAGRIAGAANNFAKFMAPTPDAMDMMLLN
jgi:hypothetical protein